MINFDFKKYAENNWNEYLETITDVSMTGNGVVFVESEEKIYNFDGPGFSSKKINSPEFTEIIPKIKSLSIGFSIYASTFILIAAFKYSFSLNFPFKKTFSNEES